MTLFKRGRIFWAYVWIDGIRYAKSTGTGHRRQAESVEHEFKEELNRRRHQIREASPDMTFGELAARFLADGSPRPYHFDRLKVLLPHFADHPIARISKPSVREYRTARHKEKRLSETTLNRDVEVLRHLLYWAVDEGFLTINPIARIRLVRERRKPRPVMSLDEEDKVIAAAAPHLFPIIISALDTGMRRTELLTQLFEHIDFNRRVLAVTHSKTPGGEAREIPLTDRAFKLLSGMAALQTNSHGLVFTFKDRPIHRIKTAWKAAIRRAGVRPSRFHDLRHTFNTRLMEAGVIQDVRKALMGHSSGEEVNSGYTHVEMPIKREAIRKLEAWVAGQRMAQTEIQAQVQTPTQTQPNQKGKEPEIPAYR
jgi:integrase